MSPSSDAASGGPTRAVVQFNPLDPALADNFWPRMHELREKAPVAWSDQNWSEKDQGFWVISDYADVMSAGTNWKAFSNARGATPVQFDLDVLRQIPLEVDPPLHRGIRRALNPFFTVAALEKSKGSIDETVDLLIDRCLELGSVDFVAEFSHVLPTMVFFEGFLGQDRADIGWVIDILNTLMVEPVRALEVMPKLFAWEADLLAVRRDEGRSDDLAGTIAHLGLDGSDGLELTERQRVETLNLMIMAGMETTMGAIGSIAILLAQNQNQNLRLRLRDADDATIGRAMDEFLRYESPVPTAGRTLTEPVEMAGCPMAADDRIVLNWAAANRDPNQFPNPDAIDFDRDNSASHVAFGAGIHRCLGNHLARREIRASIRAVCALTTFETPADFVPSYRPAFARGPVSLPVSMAR